jgi:hypothetical protein
MGYSAFFATSHDCFDHTIFFGLQCTISISDGSHGEIGTVAEPIVDV